MSLLHPVVTRFAPSPSGAMHVGHALAAYVARRMADLHGGFCLLRIEDIDTMRTRDKRWIELMMEDLDWLGLHFDGNIMVQSSRFDIYATALETLRSMGLLYPCFCTRARLSAAAHDIARAPHEGIAPQRRYSRHCRSITPTEAAERIAAGEPHSWRIDMQRVQDLIGCPTWEDLRAGVQRCIPSACEDVILSRKDTPTSYHLAVVIDDAQQGVNLVTRGADLMSSTPIHRAIQALLGLPTPLYAHHDLLLDGHTGKRLAKRTGAASLKALRDAGFSAKQVMASIDRALKRGGMWSMEE